MGPQDSLGHQQRRGPYRREPHPHRSHHRQARQGHRGGRSLQHVLHAGREVGGDRGGGAQAAGLPRSSHHGDAVVPAHSGLCRHQPRRLLHRRPLRHLHLRVSGEPGQDRSRRPQGAGVSQALQGAHAPGRARRAGRQDLLRGRAPVGWRVLGGRGDLHRSGLHRHRRGLTRALSQPGREEALRHQPGDGAGVRAAEGQGQRGGDRLCHPEDRGDLGHPRRGQPGHGQCQRGRQAALAVRPLRRRGLRDRYHLGRGDGASRPARSRMASPSGPSPAATRSGIPATCARRAASPRGIAGGRRTPSSAWPRARAGSWPRSAG